MDAIFLSNGGTTLALGSYLRADPGADYGIAGLRVPHYAENAISEGGRLAFESVGVRKMAFPLTLASGGAGLALSSLQELIALLARPGAVLDIQPEYVATGDAVRFDVLTGRWKPDHDVRHWEYGRAQGVLELDTQPFGYLPTYIILASAASVGLPGQLALPNASLIGDVPGLLSVAVQPSNPAVTTQVGTWLVDALAWSVAARPSFTSLLPGGSWVSAVASGAYAARAEAITATVLQWMLASNMAGWSQLAYYDIPAALEPAYRGRFRAFAYARQSLSLQGEFNTMQLLLDSTVLNPSGPMASANAVATLPVQAPSVYAPNLLDLGEITLPPVASGVARDVRLRLWGYKATSAATTQTFGDLAGVALLPLEGPNGILPRGLAWPGEAATAGRLVLDAYTRSAVIAIPTGPLGSQLPVVDALRYYRGGFPKAGGSTTDLTLVAGSRRKGGLYPVEVMADSPWAYWRLDESREAPTVIDSSGFVRHGLYEGSPSLGVLGLAPSGQAVAFASGGYIAISDQAAFNFADTWTAEFLAQRGGSSAAPVLTILAGGTPVTGRAVTIQVTGQTLQLSHRGIANFVTADMGGYKETHHWAVIWQVGSYGAIYKDGALAASAAYATQVPEIANQVFIGAAPSLGADFTNYDGILDEIALYRAPLSASRVAAHYRAAVTDRELTRPAPAHAAVSVLYRPRFTFIKDGV